LAFTLALAMPRIDETFVAGFAQGLWALADAQGIELVGGDTTAGPLNICITVFGEVPAGRALLRSGARPGDEVWVSGTLGDARLALEAFRGAVALDGGGFEQSRRAMECPQPRVALGQALVGVASSAIDLSDGLLGDVGHVLARSGVGAEIDLARLPRSALLAAQAPALQRECLLAGGDDYELLFTAPAAAHAAVRAAGAAAGTAVTAVGRIVEGTGLHVTGEDGRPVDLRAHHAFDHFRS
jgi:thiamine-monophosphate kinase